VLRALLGEFLGRDPSAIRFDYGAHEKPLLEDRACAFNVSRSSGLALIGITATGALGIDLEQFRDDVDVDAVAKQFFASADRAALEMVSPGKRSREFFHLWVRHEAAVKATGAGVVVPAQDLASMWVADVDIGRNYAAAVAAAGEGPYTVMMHPWSGEPHP
jgi:4'-phosphopantetheinyl transferase